MKNTKPKRSYRKVVSSLYQVLKIDPNLQDEFWYRGQPSQEHVSEGRIRLGIWNIFKGNGGIHFLRDYQRFVQDRDLVLIQEALVSQQSIQQYWHEGFELTHCGSYQRMDGLRDGVMTLSRFPRLHEPSRVKSVYAEPIFRTPKVTLITRYELKPGVHLTVANVHSTLFRSVKRATEEMTEILTPLSRYEGPLIVAGDFNTFRGPYLKRLVENMAECGLNHVSFPQDPRRSDIQKLDHIFVRDLFVERAKVESRICSSDHFPLKANLVV
ncbi:MAG: endonuclease/exonuclease/phosphatase family protein [Oligoflexus sp.]